jgi:hypothetical protein
MGDLHFSDTRVKGKPAELRAVCSFLAEVPRPPHRAIVDLDSGTSFIVSKSIFSSTMLMRSRYFQVFSLGSEEIANRARRLCFLTPFCLLSMRNEDLLRKFGPKKHNKATRIQI